MLDVEVSQPVRRRAAPLVALKVLASAPTHDARAMQRPEETAAVAKTLKAGTFSHSDGPRTRDRGLAEGVAKPYLIKAVAIRETSAAPSGGIWSPGKRAGLWALLVTMCGFVTVFGRELQGGRSGATGQPSARRA